MKAKSGIPIVIMFLFTAVCVLQAQERQERPIPVRTTTTNTSPESSSQSTNFYRLDFVIREMDGERPVDKRNYSIWVQSGNGETIAAGSEVPYKGAANNIAYRSIGVSIMCTLKEANDRPQLELRLNVSDALPPEEEFGTPVFRNITLNSKALLALGKPTTVGIVEDPGSRHRYEVNVTATKLK